MSLSLIGELNHSMCKRQKYCLFIVCVLSTIHFLQMGRFKAVLVGTVILAAVNHNFPVVNGYIGTHHSKEEDDIQFSKTLMKNIKPNSGLF